MLYDSIGVGYTTARRTDPRWMSAILAALGEAKTVLDIGAGTGNYEPVDRQVYAVEPSSEMVGQRDVNAPPVVRAVAEALPFRDCAVDAALAVLTVHHWTDWRKGIAELKRVAPQQVVLAYDTRLHSEFWFVQEYVPQIAELELSRPSAPDIADELGADYMIPLPLPWDFTDGVFPAYWRRPEVYLTARTTCSALAQAPRMAVQRGLTKLHADLVDGTWQKRHADLLELDEYDAGFRLIVSR